MRASRHHGFLIAVLIILVSPIVLRAQTGAASDWLRLETQHFTFFTNGPQDVARSTAHDLEQLRYAITQLWPEGRFEPAVPTLIYIFEDEASFSPYSMSGTLPPTDAEPTTLGHSSRAPGYLVRHEHGTYAALLIDSETRPVRFVYKQYLHQLLRAKLPTLPRWLRHGLAEYYSTFEVQGDEALIGLPVDSHINSLRWHLAETPLTLKDFLHSRVPTRDTSAPPFYPLAWVMTHYLSSDPERARQLAAFAYKVVRDVPAQQAFDASFDVDLATLEQQLTRYVKGNEFQYLRTPIDRGSHPARVIRLAPHEAVYHLGDLLAHAQPLRQSEAGQLFQHALELSPGHGRSQAGLGYLAESAGNDEAALGHYQQAISHNDEHFLSQYLYGASLVKSLGDRRPANDEENARLDRAVVALERSVEKWENFAPAWASLGYARNLQPAGSNQAVEALEKALGLLPGRHDIAFNLLLAYARVDNREAADAIVARMKHLGASEQTLTRSHEVLLTMDYRDAARQVRQNNLEEAIALFARILAHTTNPALQQQVEEQLGKLESTTQVLQFSNLYRKVTNLLAGRQIEAAAAALRELDAITQPGRQREEYEKLSKRLAALQN